MGQALDVLHSVRVKPNSTGPPKDISPITALILKFPVRRVETCLTSATPSQDQTPSRVSTCPSPSRSPRPGPVPFTQIPTPGLNSQRCKSAGPALTSGPGRAQSDAEARTAQAAPRAAPTA